MYFSDMYICMHHYVSSDTICIIIALLCSCKMISSSDIPTICEDFFDNNNIIYYYQDSLDDPAAILENISSLQIESQCLNLTIHYLCSFYYPACNKETGDVVLLCSDNCELFKTDQVCSDLILDVTEELKSVGLKFPKIGCLKENDTTTPCLDIVNGKVRSSCHCICN